MSFSGIALTVLFKKIQIDSLQVKHYIACALCIPSSCLVLYTLLKVIGLDPGWSITMATKWCQRSEWVHLDTTPFNSVFRDAGGILGKEFNHTLDTDKTRKHCGKKDIKNYSALEKFI